MLGTASILRSFPGKVGWIVTLTTKEFCLSKKQVESIDFFV
jgi:hypothetical protein